MNRGCRANQTGFVLETTVAGTLQAHGYIDCLRTNYYSIMLGD